MQSPNVVIQKIEKETEQYPCAKNKSEPTIFSARNTEQNYCFAVYFTDPVYLKVRHTHLEHKDKTVRFNISCNGR